MRQQYRDWVVWGRHIIRSCHLGAYARALDCNGICNGSSELHIEMEPRTSFQLLYTV